MSAAEKPGDIKLRAAKVIRPALVVLLAAVVIVILTYFVLHIKKAPSVEPGKKDIVPEKVDVKEGVKFSQFSGEKGRIDAKGDRNYAVDENTYRFEGHVEIVDYGKKGGREIRMAGDELTYDKGWNNFILQGHVRVQKQELVLDAPDFEYDRIHETLKTSSAVTVSSPRFSGSSQKIIYYLKDEELVLEENLQCSFRLRLPTPEPLVLSGDKLTFGFRRRRAEVEGNVGIVHGKSRGSADRVELEQFEKVDDLRVLWLRGNVRLIVEAERRAEGIEGRTSGGAASESQESTFSEEFNLGGSERQEIGADEIKVVAFLNLPIVRLVESRGRSSVRFIYDSGNATHIQGEALDMAFNKSGGLRELRVEDKARLASLDQGNNVLRMIEGAAMVLDTENSILRVGGGGNGKARISSAASDVAGDEITVLIKMNDFEASGGVHMSFRASKKEADNKGFFSKEEPVFINAQAMRYSSEKKRFLLWNQTDRVRAWQGKKVLFAQEIIAAEDGGDITCRGRVLSVFPHKPRGEEKERLVEISADRMTYDHAVNQVIFEDNCSLKTGAALVQCGLIKVDPGEGGGEVRWIRASKGASKAITIFMNTKEATGEFAEYDMEKDTIALTGRPVLKERDKGTVKGDKLTFHLADGTIRVENLDQERSVAVIKS